MAEITETEARQRIERSPMEKEIQAHLNSINQNPMYSSLALTPREIEQKVES